MKLYGVNNNPVDADEHGRVLARAIVSAASADAAARGKLYSITSAYTTGQADDAIIYLKNDSQEDIEIDSVVSGTAVSGGFTINAVTGTAGGASAVTPVNMNLGSTLLPEVTATGGAEVTGLTLGGVLGKRRILANYSEELRIKGRIILAPNTAIAVSNSATGACECVIYFHTNSLENRD